MNNKLNIALKCTKYLLVAALVALPFIGPERTEAKAEEGYTYGSVNHRDCPSGLLGVCHNEPGECSTGGIVGCELDEVVIYG